MLKTIVIVVIILFIVGRVRKIMAAQHHATSLHQRKNHDHKVIDLEQDPDTKIYKKKKH